MWPKCKISEAKNINEGIKRIGANVEFPPLNPIKC